MEFPDFVSCPFDKNHRVDPTRLALHIERCRKANPKSKLKRCPYNATHFYTIEEMVEHVKVCDCKDDFAGVLSFGDKDSKPAWVKAPQYHCTNEDEDWDAELEKERLEESKTPKIKIHEEMYKRMYSKYPRPPEATLGLGKAGRRKWNEIEKVRVRTLLDGGDILNLEYPTADRNVITVGEMIYGKNWQKHIMEETGSSPKVEERNETSPKGCANDEGTPSKASRRRRKRKEAKKNLNLAMEQLSFN